MTPSEMSKKWHEVALSGDENVLSALLHDDAVFESPVVHTPQRGKPITLSTATLASTTPPLRIDGDWTLSVPEPWSVAANGVCQGGDVVVANAFGERTVRVAAPFCDPTVQP